MKSNPNAHMKCLLTGAAALLLGLAPSSLAKAGTYDSITETDSASDFTGVAAVYTNLSPASALPISSIQIANDSNFLYVLINYSSAVDPGSLPGGGEIYTAVDNDASAATGFDIYGEGLVGSEVGFAYDYPFQQTAGNFEGVNGVPPFTSGEAIQNYGGTATFEEFQISLSDSYSFNGSTIPVFPNSSFALGFYNGNTSSGFTGAIDYTLAVAPEPRTWAMILGSLVCLLGLSRWRRVFVR